MQCRPFCLKLLAGQCKGVLNNFAPSLFEPSKSSLRFSRHTLPGIQISPTANSKSLDIFNRGFMGQIPKIWSRIPQDIISRGQKTGWLKIKKTCAKFLLHGDRPQNKINNATVKPKVSLKAESSACMPENVDMDLCQLYMSRKNDGILII